MVKNEPFSDEENYLDDKTLVSKAGSLNSNQHLAHGTSLPSSSSGHLKAYFVGMGFSPTLVDKVLEENVEVDQETLLDTLFTYTAIEKASSEDAASPDRASCSVKQEAESPLEFTTDDEQDVKDPNICLDKKSQLLLMKFTEDEVDFAIDRLGDAALLEELVDFIVATQVAGNEETTCERLFGTMDTTIYLLQMGFTEGEISTAIERLGEDAPLAKLAASISDKRKLKDVVKEEVQLDDESYSSLPNQNKCDYQANTSTITSRNHSSSLERWTNKGSCSDDVFDDFEDTRRAKKGKFPATSDQTSSYYNGHSYPRSPINDDFGDYEETKPAKEAVPNLRTSNLQGNVRGFLSKPPYFFYGSVVPLSQTTWRKLSQFLYGTEPETVYSENFSALKRTEGYMHNLPAGVKCFIHPKPPTSVVDALPKTSKWWPSWDERKKLSFISDDTTDVTRVCERLEKIIRNSRGILSQEQRLEILHHCRKLNLLWVGPNKLSAAEPEQMERILGYPLQHTELWGLEAFDRLRLLKYSFQTDTLGYSLSVLKSLYPNGIRVLSVYTGTGGALVSLHRLGIHLRCVVSVEPCLKSQKLISRWWRTTEQTGGLEQINGVEKLTTQKLERLFEQFGMFDIVIGSNPGTYISNNTMEQTTGVDLSLFFEYVRVVQRVRSMSGRTR